MRTLKKMGTGFWLERRVRVRRVRGLRRARSRRRRMMRSSHARCVLLASLA
jgi:hypothetical protein